MSLDASPDEPAAESHTGSATNVVRFPTSRSNDTTHGPQRVPSPAARLREVIGDVIREERLDQARTLADVAEQAAVSLPYLSEVERGRKEVSSDLLAAITDALGVDLAEVLERAVPRLRRPTTVSGGRPSVERPSRRMQGGSGIELLAA